MAVHTLPLWEITLDGFQIFLCGGILIFLIYNKIKCNRMILNVIHQERRRLQNDYDIEEKKEDADSFPSGCSECIKNASRLDGKNRSKSKVMDNVKILMLSKKGLTVKEISRSVHRPRGEVELILRLNNIRARDINRNIVKSWSGRAGDRLS
jgi:hypothetical protein